MLTGVSKFLFKPLALAVIFAMLTSYLLSRTLVATMAINLLPEDPNEQGMADGWASTCERFEQGFDRFKERYRRGLDDRAQPSRAGARMHSGDDRVRRCCCCAALARISFHTSMRARFSCTCGCRPESGWKRPNGSWSIGREHRAQNRFQPTNSTDDRSYRFADLLGAAVLSDRYVLGRRTPICRFELSREASSEPEIYQQIRRAVNEQLPGVQIYSQAADITSQVLNFGLSAPIDVQFQGRDAYSSYKLAVELLPKSQSHPGRG